MKYPILSALICCLLPGMLAAQNFQYKAKLNPATQNDFYRINISPEVSAFSQNNLEDLRLFDNEGKEVPYLLKKEMAGQSETEFITYPTSSSIAQNRQTVIVENKDKRRVDKFLFNIKNADASRLVRISGSDNKNDWFVVRDSFYFETYANDQEPVVKKMLRFPASDYSFYKIEIVTGNNESPLNILSAGNYSTNAIHAIYQQVKGLSFTRTDSNKVTYLKVTCHPANRIDKLTFDIAAPEMYHRVLKITKYIEPVERVDSYAPSHKKYREPTVPDYREYELSSDKPTSIICNDFSGYSKNGEFLIEIENKDDQPLTIKEIKAYQLNTTITAKLDKDKAYFLYFGDSLLAQPAYDIVYFEHNLPKNIQTIDHLPVQAKSHKDKDEYNASKDKYIVWIGLGLAGIVLFFLTINMMKKMKSQ